MIRKGGSGLAPAQVATGQVNFLPDSTIEPNPPAGMLYRHKFSRSENSKDLHAGSNPSEKTLIIRGIIITAPERSSRLCDRKIAETANKGPG